MNEYIAMWKNYVNFTDRTSRKGYWMAFLFNCIAGLVLGILAMLTSKLAFLGYIYSLATIVPGVAITIRRLRDAGLHWAKIFLGLIPVAGEIILIVLLCKPTAATEGTQV
ncbi:MAG: DUF805 domain-containing protein [Clostridia bacterium]|nr:DUF805 domain-containing protein [Clostridia bacterium]